MHIFKTWIFKWWEISLLKICLLFLGIILALYFGDYLIGLIWLWWLLFIIPTLYFIPKILKNNNII